ncbi:MAG: hypothetical protein LW650_01725 [Planctomycetaceae bacterium]|nr:hypothetical protein [Phycisphaerales bacterium]MCE2652252.1 hypothetical protein [Planctomycetaceae bacterium]
MNTRGMRSAVVWILGAAMTAATGGCASQPELSAPEVQVAPYGTAGNEIVWALAPLRNESGVSQVDVLAVSDTFVGVLTEVRGITCLPMNRTLAAMRALEMASVNSPTDAKRLAMMLGADGVVVGTITAWEPYDPPKLGMNVALFARDGAMATAPTGVNPVSLANSPVDTRPAGFAERPLAVVSEHLDGKSHEVQMDVRRYAEGRHEDTFALGWRRYLASMELFTQFVANHLTARLMQSERLRLARQSAPVYTPSNEGNTTETLRQAGVPVGRE